MPLHDTDLLEAASLTLKQAAQDGLAPVCLHIADATGAPLLFLRMAGSVERAVGISAAKARTAALMGTSTREFHERLIREHLTLADFAAPNMTALPGGLPVRTSDGAIAAGVGISGRRPDEDEALAGLLVVRLEQALCRRVDSTLKVEALAEQRSAPAVSATARDAARPHSAAPAASVRSVVKAHGAAATAAPAAPPSTAVLPAAVLSVHRKHGSDAGYDWSRKAAFGKLREFMRLSGPAEALTAARITRESVLREAFAGLALSVDGEAAEQPLRAEDAAFAAGFTAAVTDFWEMYQDRRADKA